MIQDPGEHKTNSHRGMLSQLQIASRLQPQKSQLINCLTTFLAYIRAAAPAASLRLPGEIIKNNYDHAGKQEPQPLGYEAGIASKG